jgi:hypothetical protein
LTRLADHLDTHGSPIDYQRRRRLNYRDLLPAGQWQRLCHDAGAPPGFDLRARPVRCFLFERISGIPAELAPPAYAITSTPHRSALLELPAYLTPQLLAALDNAATEFLTAAGVHDEPVTWQPPPELVSDLDLPSDDPDHVDIKALHELLRQQQRISLSHAAEFLGTSIDSSATCSNPSPARQPHTRSPMLRRASRHSRHRAPHSHRTPSPPYTTIKACPYLRSPGGCT